MQRGGIDSKLSSEIQPLISDGAECILQTDSSRLIMELIEHGALPAYSSNHVKKGEEVEYYYFRLPRGDLERFLTQYERNGVYVGDGYNVFQDCKLVRVRDETELFTKPEEIDRYLRTISK